MTYYKLKGGHIMLKMFPFFFVFLPLGIALVAWFFGRANLMGMLLAGLLHATGVIIALWYVSGSHDLTTLFLVILLASASFWTVPWFGALFSLSIRPAPGPAPVKGVADAYKNLTPEQQEFAKRAGVAAAKAGAEYAATHLRKKGATHLADAIKGLAK